MRPSAYRFGDAPRRVYWELTRACALACRHCRAVAEPRRAPEELGTEECQAVLRDLARASPPPHVIFTGGDPLQRADLLALVRYAAALGLPVAVAPSATEGLSDDTVTALAAAGVTAMSLSLDGATAEAHDGVRGVPGCFAWTLAAAARVRAAGLPLQVNTLVCGETVAHLDAIADVAATLAADRWSLFFLIPVGRGVALGALDAAACRRALEALLPRTHSWPFVLTTTEAPHFRRLALERMRAAAGAETAIARGPLARGFGLRDGNGIMFIAANGDVQPSGFLPLVAGNVRRAPPLRIYRETPLFRALREPERFGGRCGICPYHAICGGSRARAFATSGDPLAEDPLCDWAPSGRRADPPNTDALSRQVPRGPRAAGEAG